ncbi:hypothetical protein DIPPA_28421 [Diplonema papillatum]|nr:hypothetical protein DIPPA_28421 [Diplonema papillatum]
MARGQLPLRVALAGAALLCVGMTATTIWTAAAIMSHRSVSQAREDQLVGASRHVEETVLAYFKTASKHALAMQMMYKTAYARDANETISRVKQDFGTSFWTAFDQNSQLSSVTISYLRHPDIVARQHGDNRYCDVDVLTIGKQLVVYATPATSGVVPPVNCSELGDISCLEGSIAISFIAGKQNWSEPLQPRGVYTYSECAAWVGNSISLWSREGIPGNLTARDTGIREPTWNPILVHVGAQIYKKVNFDVPGPAWAPNSAVGSLAQLVAGQGYMGEAPLEGLLQLAAAASEYEDVLFVLTDDAYLLATSDARQPSLQKNAEGNVVGLVPASNASLVMDPYLSVSRELIRRYCHRSAGIEYCDWSQVPQMLTIGSSLVAPRYLEDPHAASLNLLLVTLVSTYEIQKPAVELNINLAIISGSILLFFSILSMAVAEAFIRPFNEFAVKLTDASQMSDLSNARAVSILKELFAMQLALQELIRMLVEYKSFLPATLFQDKDPSEDCSDSSFLSVSSSRRQSSRNPSRFGIRKDDVETRASASKSSGNVGDALTASDMNALTAVADVTACANPLVPMKHNSIGRGSGRKPVNANPRGSGSPHNNNRRRSAVDGGIDTRRALRSKVVTILALNMKGWTATARAISVEKLVTDLGTMVSVVTRCIDKKGSIDRFNGDHIMVSWNAIGQCTSAIAGAQGYNIAKSLVASDLDFAANGIACGMAMGSLLVGISGDQTTRAFNLVGPAVSVAWQMSTMAGAYCGQRSFELVIAHSLFIDVQLQMEAVKVGRLFCAKFSDFREYSESMPFYLVAGIKELDERDNEEWMYEIQGLNDRIEITTLAELLESVVDETTFSAAKEPIKEACGAVGKAHLGPLLTECYANFRSRCICKM